MGTQRNLGLASATALVVANMVGTGVFTTSGFLLRDLGSPWLVLAAWALGGGIATLGALSYGALARQIPESGGEYLFLSRTLHPALGYVAGWVSLLVGFSAPCAAVAFAFGEYLTAWLPGWPPQIAGSVLLVLFAVLHGTHVRRGAGVQTVLVLCKVAVILAFVGLGVSRVSPAPVPSPAPFSPATFAVSLVWVSFSYSGWNAAVYVGSEVRDPTRNLPRSLLAGTAVVILLYLALNAVFVFAVPAEALAGQVQIGRIAAAALGGELLANVMSALIALALATSVSSMVMAGPRVYARMALDGYLPRALAPAAGPPGAAIVLQSLVALALLWTATYDGLLTYIGFTLSLSTAATVIGLFVLRRRAGPARVPVVGWPWVPALFVLSVCGVAGFTIAGRPLESLAGLGTLALGLVAWRLSRPGAGPGPTAG